MSQSSFEESDEDDFDDETEVEVEADVVCPYCGETNSIVVDITGGMAQDYVEDCQVCCRAWHVHIAVNDAGSIDVWLDEAG